MRSRELLRKIYYENRAINRNLQRLINIGCLGILGAAAKEFKIRGDKRGMLLVKSGLLLTVILEMLLMAGGLKSLSDCRKKEAEIRRENGGVDNE